MRLDKEPEVLADAIRATSEYFNIAPVYVEKDYWICKVLQQLSRSKYVETVVFKGGTSLSKGYELINRFSEDIDLAVVIGELNGNKTKTLISNVCKCITNGLEEQNEPGITSKGSKYRKTIYGYKSLTSDLLYGIKANRVILEISSFANPYPYEKRNIKSIITSYLEIIGMKSIIDEYDLSPFDVNVLDKRRTLCEKISSLLRFSFDSDVVVALSGKIRHFYDIYYLLKNTECADYAKTALVDDLKELIEHDKGIFDNPPKWKDAQMQESPLFISFDLLWNELNGVYERELQALSYSSIPKGGDVKQVVGDLLLRLKAQL